MTGRMRAAFLLVALIAGQATADTMPDVFDLHSGMTFEQVKASKACRDPRRRDARLTCRPITYAGRKMAVEISIPGDALDRMRLTLSLGKARKAAEPVLAEILPVLAHDFGPLQLDGRPVTGDSVFRGLENEKLIMFASDPEKVIASRYLVVQVDRWDGFYRLTLIVYRDLG